MKPEQLDDKLLAPIEDEVTMEYDPIDGNFFEKEDVKSAIEWLKRELSNLWNNSDSLALSEILDVVDKAFKDITHKEEYKKMGLK